MTTCPACTNPATRLVRLHIQGRLDERCPACAKAWHEAEAARISREFTAPAMAGHGFTGNGHGGYRPATTTDTET